MAKRMQSPSSINIHKQCPRKYYYIYIKRLKTLPSIHLVRGSIVHEILEDFFEIDIEKVPAEGTQQILQTMLLDNLKTKWTAARKELDELDLTEAQELFYYHESETMLKSWLLDWFKKLNKEDLPFIDAFKKWTPKTEIEYRSDILQVRGFIDAIHELEDEVILMDYKTSKRDHISPEYRLQLAIYALLYQLRHGKLASKVGINFLKHGERLVDVDPELLKLARLEIELIHTNTESNDIADYPMKPSPLCKWSTGQCDFYSYCYDENGKLKEN